MKTLIHDILGHGAFLRYFHEKCHFIRFSRQYVFNKKALVCHAQNILSNII